MKKKDEIDAFLGFYKAHMPQNVTLIKNQQRYDEAKQAIQDITDFVRSTDKNAIINIAPDNLTGSSICVEIIASLVIIDMIDKFCAALSKANNFEICPRTDGYIVLGIVFEDVFAPAQLRKEQ